MAKGDAYEAETVVDGYTVKALREAFEAVQHPDDWKLPIDANVPHALLEMTRAAVMFFQASPVKVIAKYPKAVAITSKGYQG